MKKGIKFRAVGIVVVIVTWAAGGAIAMLLWNALLPHIFGFPCLNYLEAVGIFALARILFGGINGFGFGGERGIRERGHSAGHANRLREKWMTMSEDEQREFVRKERDFAGLNRLHSQLHEFFNDKEGNEQNDEVSTGKDNSNE